MFFKRKRHEKELNEIKAQLKAGSHYKPDPRPLRAFNSIQEIEAYVRGEISRYEEPDKCAEKSEDACIVKKDWRGRKITDKQSAIINFISDYQKKNGFSPSIRDIAKAKGITVKGAYDHVAAIEKKGLLTHVKGTSRSIQIVEA
jgi:sulfur relay (sulfurtransferase) DsrC/TusE family protein